MDITEFLKTIEGNESLTERDKVLMKGIMKEIDFFHKFIKETEGFSTLEEVRDKLGTLIEPSLKPMNTDIEKFSPLIEDSMELMREAQDFTHFKQMNSTFRNEIYKLLKDGLYSYSTYVKFDTAVESITFFVETLTTLSLIEQIEKPDNDLIDNAVDEVREMLLEKANQKK